MKIMVTGFLLLTGFLGLIPETKADLVTQMARLRGSWSLKVCESGDCDDPFFIFKKQSATVLKNVTYPDEVTLFTYNRYKDAFCESPTYAGESYFCVQASDELPTEMLRYLYVSEFLSSGNLDDIYTYQLDSVEELVKNP